jgi:hypothetical protein
MDRGQSVHFPFILGTLRRWPGGPAVWVGLVQGLAGGPPCECLGGCAWALVGTASLAPSQVGVLPLLWPSHGACFRHSAAAQGSFDVIKIRFRKLSEGMMTVASFQKAIRKHDDCGFGQAPSQLFLRRLCRRV